MARGDLKCRLDEAALDIVRLICASQLAFVWLRCARSSPGSALESKHDQRSRANEARHDLSSVMLSDAQNDHFRGKFSTIVALTVQRVLNFTDVAPQTCIRAFKNFSDGL